MQVAEREDDVPQILVRRATDEGSKAHFKAVGDESMDKAEPLCDFRYIKAEYEVAKPTDRSSRSCFRIAIHPSSVEPYSFIVAETNADQFAAELDALAAIIRARVIRARLRGEEIS